MNSNTTNTQSPSIEQKEQIFKLFDEGKSLREIAELTGIKVNSVKAITNSYKRKQSKNYAEITDDTVNQIINLYISNRLPANEIAKSLNLSVASVQDILKQKREDIILSMFSKCDDYDSLAKSCRTSTDMVKQVLENHKLSYKGDNKKYNDFLIQFHQDWNSDMSIDTLANKYGTTRYGIQQLALMWRLGFRKDSPFICKKDMASILGLRNCGTIKPSSETFSELRFYLMYPFTHDVHNGQAYHVDIYELAMFLCKHPEVSESKEYPELFRESKRKWILQRMSDLGIAIRVSENNELKRYSQGVAYDLRNKRLKYDNGIIACSLKLPDLLLAEYMQRSGLTLSDICNWFDIELYDAKNFMRILDMKKDSENWRSYRLFHERMSYAIR